MAMRTGKTYSAVYDTFDNVNVKNQLKYFCFPMRTGKTYLTIKDFISYLFNTSNVNWVIITSPLNGIIKQNKVDLKRSAAKNNFIFENDLDDVLRLLEKGEKVVSYLTNATTFSQQLTKDFMRKVDRDRVGIFVDEADYGSTDCADNLMPNKAYSNKNYKGSMYKFIAEMIAPYSTHTYALTATPSFQAKGFFPTKGSMSYKIYQDMLPGEQEAFAARVAWAGEAIFFSCDENPLFQETDQTEQYILKMLQSMVDVEKNTGFKRSAIIQVQDNDEKWNEDEVRAILSSSEAHKIMRQVVNKNDNFAAVMNNKEIYRFNLYNERTDPKTKTHKSQAEMDIFDDIDDPEAPMRVILVKMMAGRGVTLKTVKEVMTLKRSNPVTHHGHPTESREQFIGRGKTVYPGSVSVGDLYDTYDADITNVWRDKFPNKMINTYRYWAPAVDANKKAWENHLLHDACTFNMLDWEIAEMCPHCGQTLPNKSTNVSIDVETLEKTLQIAA